MIIEILKEDIILLPRFKGNYWIWHYTSNKYIYTNNWSKEWIEGK